VLAVPHCSPPHPLSSLQEPVAVPSLTLVSQSAVGARPRHSEELEHLARRPRGLGSKLHRSALPA